jgi:peptidoglycan/xylan/chitin deacetylase (PgdA/CDA1 family)
MNKYFGLLVFAGMSLSSSFAQQKGLWNNKKCAVSLTYDDALNVHLDNAIPILDSLGLKATFYLSGYSGALNNRIPEWRAIAKNGHELANHTLFHPCLGGRPGREFVKADNDLNNYSIKRIDDEIKMTNTLLKAIDGKTQRTFAYPCGDLKIGDSSYFTPVKNEFVAARGVKGEMLQPQQIDLSNIGCYGINGETGQQLIDLVKRAMASNTLVVFLFHGVGGEHGLNVSLQAHRQLLQFLKQNEKDIWIAPMLDVATYVSNYQKGIK